MKQKFHEILGAVRTARDRAFKEAREANANGHLQSRGVFVSVTITREGKEENALPGEDRLWKGTKGDLQDALDDVAKKFPGWTIKSFALFGGFDWRERVNDQDYEPLVSEWTTDEMTI